MSTRILVLGFGNPGRRDDGLGPALVSALEAAALPGVTLESDYQLNVEDAAAVAEHEMVVFVDAAVDGPEPFSFRRLEPGQTMSFSSHSVSPAALLAMARDLFQAQPQAFLMGVRGYEFNEFGTGLSPRAAENLAAATSALLEALRCGQIDRLLPTRPSHSGRKSPSESNPEDAETRKGPNNSRLRGLRVLRDESSTGVRGNQS